MKNVRKVFKRLREDLPEGLDSWIATSPTSWKATLLLADRIINVSTKAGRVVFEIAPGAELAVRDRGRSSVRDRRRQRLDRCRAVESCRIRWFGRRSPTLEHGRAARSSCLLSERRSLRTSQRWPERLASSRSRWSTTAGFEPVQRLVFGGGR